MTTATQAQIVTFRIGGDLFAADIFAVERVLRFQAATPIPNVPAWIAGVIDYQGRVVAVVDLRLRFGMPAGDALADARILVFNVEGEWIAAAVDGVLDVTGLELATLAPPPPLIHGIAGEYLRGLVRRGDRLVVLLDVPHLLSTSERIALDAAASGVMEVSESVGVATDAAALPTALRESVPRG
jgi:purine-binding chemotaxis protein CheW